MAGGDFVLQDGQKIVMAGDSITDCGHNDENPLGGGYVKVISALAAAKRPDKKFTFINEGISGNKVTDLSARWDSILAHRPDWLSIFIGVNDVWHQYKEPPCGVEIDKFTATYRELLEITKSKLGGCGLILMTPGVIEEKPDSDANICLKPYIEAVKQLARKFDAFCVDIHAEMLKAAAISPDAITRDGVHPNDKGHALIALKWLEALNW